MLDRTPQTAFNDEKSQAEFDETNGALKSYCVQGQEYLKDNAFVPVMFDDNEDPWGWNMKTVGTNYQAMKAKIIGRIVERGPVYTKLENVYELGNSEVCIWYKKYTQYPYIDIDVRVTWNDDCKGLKLAIPYAKDGEFIGQTAFGTQTYEKDMEQCAQKFCGIDDGENVLSVYANYLGGCSVENGVLYVTLFNGSVYCAHPIGDLPIVDDKRCNDCLEKGRHSFKLRLAVDKREQLEKNALEFTQIPYLLNGYPHGEGKKQRESIISLSNEHVCLTSLRSIKSDLLAVRLINNTADKVECDCKLLGKNISLSFGTYEVKTLYFDGEQIVEKEEMICLD